MIIIITIMMSSNSGAYWDIVRLVLLAQGLEQLDEVGLLLILLSLLLSLS